MLDDHGVAHEQARWEMGWSLPLEWPLAVISSFESDFHWIIGKSKRKKAITITRPLHVIYRDVNNANNCYEQLKMRVLL